MNPWDIDPDLYLPVFRPLARKVMAWLKGRRRRRAASAARRLVGCRG
jgi:hypothetical protein